LQGNDRFPYGSGRTSTKRYAVVDVCSNPAPATEKAPQSGAFCFLH
jgi:hypothetical protein